MIQANVVKADNLRRFEIGDDMRCMERSADVRDGGGEVQATNLQIVRQAGPTDEGSDDPVDESKADTSD